MSFPQVEGGLWLSGIGVAANAPFVQLVQSELSIAGEIGIRSAPAALWVYNVGLAPLTIDHPDFLNSTGSFEVSRNTCANVAPGGRCVIEVTIVPTEGFTAAQLVLTDGAPDSPQTITVSAYSNNTSHLDAEPGVVFLSSDGTLVQQTVTLTNHGMLDAGFTFAIDDSFNLDSHQCNASLASGASCTVVVSWNASQATATGNLDVGYGDGYNGMIHSLVVPLDARRTDATVPPYTATPHRLIFQSQTVGVPSAIQTVTVDAHGGTVPGGLTATIRGPFEIFQACTPGGGTCQIQLVFAPSDRVGSVEGELILSDPATGWTQTVALLGEIMWY